MITFETLRTDCQLSAAYSQNSNLGNGVSHKTLKAKLGEAFYPYPLFPPIPSVSGIFQKKQGDRSGSMI